MSQADFTKRERTRLKRFVLQMENKTTGVITSYRFRVNPESYSKEMPQRTSIVKTQSTLLFEDYGQDVKTITFSGQTGLKSRRDFDGNIKNGKDKLDELQEMIHDYGNTAGDGNKSRYAMTFYNLTDDEAYKVHLSPQGFKIDRSVEESLLYRYEISLVIIGEGGEPSDDDISTSNIGNDYHSPWFSSDRYEKSQTQIEEEAKAKNNQAMDTISRGNQGNGNRKEGYASLGVNSAGKEIYNPRVTTNGLRGSVDNMSLAIGYGLGGF